MKPKLLAATLILAFILGVGWAAQSQPADTMKRLPGGSWTLVARESGQALLVPKPRRQQGRTEAQEIAGLKGQALLITPDAPPSFIAARSRGLFAAGNASQPRVWSTQFAGRKVLFNPVTQGSSIHAVPGRPGDYIFDAEGTVWALQAGAAPRKLAADTAGDFTREDLAGGAGFEQGRDLIWAANPVASPDGRFVAYVSNREALHEEAPGQSVWLLDSDSGEEEALLFNSGESFTPLGWMEDELLFTDDRGGVSAIDPATRQVRRISNGMVLAVDPERVVALLEGNLPAQRRIVIAGPDRRSRIGRVAGYEYAASADFSPDGSRLAIVLSAVDGRKLVQIVDVATGKSELLPLPDPRREALVDPPRWVDDQNLLVTASLRRNGAERSSLLPVPVSNAR